MIIQQDARSRRKRLSVSRQNRSERLKPLIDGHQATCPRCRKEMDLLEIEILPEIAAYSDETVPILRCPACHWTWALRYSPGSLPRRAR